MARYFARLFLVSLMSFVGPFIQTGAHNSTSTAFGDLLSAFEESLQMVETALAPSRQRLSAATTTRHLFTLLRRPEPETQDISRAAEIFQTTLQVLKNRARGRKKRHVPASALLSWEDVEQIAALSQCPPTSHPTICQHSHLSKYRSISGVCNNRGNPLWGAANIPLVRWLPAEYEDGEREPKGWNEGQHYNGYQLPKPREVSLKILRSSSDQDDDAFSQMLVEWGQYIDHDITFTPQSSGKAVFWSGMGCLNTCMNVHPCFPILEAGEEGCMPFFRSASACFVPFQRDIRNALQRQQMNSISSFIDASVVYGHTPKLQSSLRDFSGFNGKLAVNEQFADSSGRAYLPSVAMLPSPCHQASGRERVECFSAGDGRANEGLPLMILHTLWLREHNRIAGTLKRINEHWSPETVYQETRKIIGALHQIITMRDYLPKIIGLEAYQLYLGAYQGYDPHTDPSASNVFATAAFRFGHATVAPILRRLNHSSQEHQDFPHLRLHQSFFSPWRIVHEGGIEPVLRGVIRTPARALSANALLSEEVTERLVVLHMQQHMDLAALNLQRGRDHGLPGYNAWRRFCGLAPVTSLEDLSAVLGDIRLAKKILKVYKHPENIDVWLGGLVEPLVPGARTGPLFACLIGKQMRALRDGDRFWWEAEGEFSPEQKLELLKGSLSRIICDNSDIREVLPDAFMFFKNPSAYLSCEQISSLNLEAWREEKSEDLKRCGTPRKIENGDFILSSPNGKLVALYSCYHGYKLTGPAARVCEGQHWKGPTPQCT